MADGASNSDPVFPEPLWDVGDVARFLKITPKALYARLSRLGAPPAIRLGARQLRFDPAAVRAWVREQQEPPPARTWRRQVLAG